MNILYQFDEKYTAFAATSIYSLLNNAASTSRINIYILESGISADSKEKLYAMIKGFNQNVFFISGSMLELECKNLGMPSYRGSMSANLRLFIEKVIPNDVERIIYLDSDTIVLSDLSDLFNANISNLPLGMVQDSLVRRHKLDIGFKKDDKYYNSGMLLIDLNRWRELNCTQMLIDHIKNVRASYPNPDQDLLNVVFSNYIAEIHPKYNFQPVHRAFNINNYYKVYGKHGYYDQNTINEAICSPSVLHFFRFVGQFPWHKNSIHPDHNIFMTYLSKTEWSDMKLWDNDKSIIFSIERILYRILPKIIFLFIFHQSHEIFTALENRKFNN